MTCDRDSQSMEFIKRHGFHGPCFSVCENYGLSNDLRFRSLERMQDRCCAELGTWHERFHFVRGGFEFSIPAASQEARFRAVAGHGAREARFDFSTTCSRMDCSSGSDMSSIPTRSLRDAVALI